MKNSRAYRGCFTSNNSKWKTELENWLDKLLAKPDQTQAYIKEINNMKRIFYENEVKGKNYQLCASCVHSKKIKTSCPLVWRRRRYAISPHPVNYMKSQDDYFKSFEIDERKPIT